MTIPPGPFLFSEDPAAYRAAGALVVRIPAKARGKEKLLSVLAAKLRFPGYFGHNWDALEECLRDLSWLGDQPRVVIVHEALPFSSAGETLSIYQAILADAVAVHRQRGTPPLLEVVFPAPLMDNAPRQA
jgi:hypothetical protein